ncbi:RNA polymerase sigma factor [Paenibacillus abyssi]|uniref:RNA polymerase sigma factor n=1 Tax=Paenibacillus abyssi TaxID=1340531 RepID=A0A917FYU9_9BACL|nr:sigma-70 family RNA polymerase sigma factor [Paenibacillus abyssi]GGG14582.1 RNA polymerase sigma factor [Paenibacillus abyssi]
MEEAYWKYLEHMDSESFRQLMVTYGQDVWNLAFLMTKRHHLADDITQDVFLRAYKAIGTFRGASSIRTWLLSITRNISINYLRTAFVRKVMLTERLSVRETSPSAEKVVLAHALSDEIWEAVLRLPLKLREVLVLHVKYEMTTKEIADALRISEGTVKSRLARARRKMSISWKESAAYE